MAKIICNQKLSVMSEGQIWSASNGATRRTLTLINKLTGYEVERDEFFAQIAFLDKGNHSFIFLNPPKPDDKRILGLFLNNAYGYQVLEGKEIFGNASHGGYGNSCSQFGVYEVGAILEVNTYKNRNSPSYYKLTEEGWIDVPAYEVRPDEVQEV